MRAASEFDINKILSQTDLTDSLHSTTDDAGSIEGKAAPCKSESVKAKQSKSEQRVPTSISHDTATRMLHAADQKGIGALDFMGAEMGLGVFVVTIGDNRVACHQGGNSIA